MPFESHVQSLFTFSLGVISGVEGMRRWLNRQPLQVADLPQAHVFAGGGLDQLAGDAFLEARQSWFLIEMKRERGHFEDEQRKLRVTLLAERLHAWSASKNATLRDLLRRSWTAHRFVYGCRRNGGGLAVSTESYTQWIAGREVPAMDLAAFLLEAGTSSMPGFSWDQLIQYVTAMNDASGVLGTRGVEEMVRSTFAVAVSESGSMTVDSLESVLKRIQAHAARTAAATAAAGHGNAAATGVQGAIPGAKPGQ